MSNNEVQTKGKKKSRKWKPHEEFQLICIAYKERKGRFDHILNLLHNAYIRTDITYYRKKDKNCIFN